MTTNDDQTLLILNDLLVAVRDAEKGFQFAADRVHEPELVELFAGLVLQRAKFAQEIEARIRTLRSAPRHMSDPVAALHRAWMGLKAAIESNQAHAILAECERGEDVSVSAYATALTDTRIDGQTRTLVQRQYELVQAAHDRIRQLRDSAAYAHR